VDAVAEDHAPAAASGLLLVEAVVMVVVVALVMVAVPVELGLLEQEEEQQAEQQVRNRLCGLALRSNASGSTSSSAVPSSTPADRLTRWCTTRVSTPIVRLAATTTDSRPPRNVAAMM
jgi:hypothetical protein